MRKINSTTLEFKRKKKTHALPLVRKSLKQQQKSQTHTHAKHKQNQCINTIKIHFSTPNN